MPFPMMAVAIAQRERLQRLQARAKAQGMSEAEFTALAAEVNERAKISATWGTIAERLDAIEAGLRKHAAEDWPTSHRFMK